jgi:hypothetical protein
LGPLGTAATNRPIVTAPGDYDDGEIGGMIGRGNQSTRRKPAPIPLCPPQTPTCCPDVNPGRPGGKPATKRLSCGTALTPSGNTENRIKLAYVFSSQLYDLTLLCRSHQRKENKL